MLRVVQVVPAIGEESSGPSYSVPALCGGLMENGCDVSLHFTGTKPTRDFAFPVLVYPISRFPHPRLARSPKMLAGLTMAAQDADIIHNNSLWMMPNVYPAWAKRGTKCKLVTAPRGTLAAWSLSHHWLQKKLFGWFGGQYAALRATDMWHATSEKEYEEIRALGYRQPVAIVPIGMEVPVPEVSGFGFRVSGSELGMRLKKVVFFGRLHKVKGVDRLVRAWELVARDGWELVIAGPDCGMLEELKGIVAEKRLPRVSFVGEINGSAKYEFLAGADIYVLPSDTENFGVTVAEALASGTPVIASQGTPWQGLETEKAGRWIPVGVESLAEALKEMMSMSDEERAAMGVRGREWIARDFSWKGIGAKMTAAYEWLLGWGERPEWVKVE